ncbi:MAG: cyclic lactone autoinducer peptide [Bacilli bacterium]|nr:cyclic lactone autoinducer peptide [Bacilli bacterium]
MNIFANLLSNVTSFLANTGSSACIGLVFEEPACPEEIL